MATAHNAALLDELMGKYRNAASLDEVRMPHWSDDDVCRYYLCGFCPHSLFTNTRADLGVCDKSHDEKLRDDYRASSRYQRMGYEAIFADFLRTVIADVDRRIQRGHERIKLGAMSTTLDGRGGSPRREEREDRLQELNTRIGNLLEEAERLGCSGDVEKSQALTQECEVLQKERERLVSTNNQSKELEVCEICGAFRIKEDAACRQEEHLTGKMHLGYAQIRDYLREYEEAQAKKREERRSRDVIPAKSSISTSSRDRGTRGRERSSGSQEAKRASASREHKVNGNSTRRSRSRSKGDSSSRKKSSHDRDRRERSRDRDRHSRRRSRSRSGGARRRSRSSSRDRGSTRRNRH